MRISNEQAQQILAAQKVKGAKGPKDVAGIGDVKGAASVSVSTAGQEIQKALAAMNGMSDVRADRVAEIKAQIDGGTYAVNSRDVAESLLRRAADKLL